MRLPLRIESAARKRAEHGRSCDRYAEVVDHVEGEEHVGAIRSFPHSKATMGQDYRNLPPTSMVQ